jgi:hypothetical protein
MTIRKNPGATAWFPTRRDKQLNCQRSLSDLKHDRFLTLKVVQRGDSKVMGCMAKNKPLVRNHEMSCR